MCPTSPNVRVRHFKKNWLEAVCISFSSKCAEVVMKLMEVIRSDIFGELRPVLRQNFI